MYLPRLLEQMNGREVAAAIAFQARCIFYLVSAGLPMRSDLHTLGITPRDLASYTTKLQDQILRDMRTAGGMGRLRAMVNPTEGIGPRILDFFHPPDPASMPAWHKRVLRVWTIGARWADRALA